MEIFLLIIIGIVIFSIINGKNKEFITKKNNKGKLLSNYSIKNIFEKEELKLYKKLLEYNKLQNYFILSKVRIANFVKNHNYSDFTKISQKHIDFLIVDIQGNILLLIELDGYSHNYKKTKISDNFKNNLFNELQIPLLRFQNYKNHDLSKIDKYL